jgi:hypothetical protein
MREEEEEDEEEEEEEEKKRRKTRKGVGARQTRPDQTRPDQIRVREKSINNREWEWERLSIFAGSWDFFGLADGVAGDLLLSSGCCTWPWVHNKSGQDSCGHVLSLSALSCGIASSGLN